MPYKPFTHEQFHTGLSAMGNDQKWADMLNFRSQNGRTRAIPRKFSLIAQPNLHTIINVGRQVNYAIGTGVSFIFSGNDLTEPLDSLWRVKVTHDADAGVSPRPLPIRGYYTGDAPISFDVVLEKPEVTPVTPPEPVMPTISCYGCCDNGIVQLIGLNKIAGVGDPIPGGVVKFFQAGALVAWGVPNGGGMWQVNVPIGYYYLNIEIPGYHTYSQGFDVTVGADDLEYSITPTTEPVHYLQAGTRILLYVGPEYGPMPVAPNGFSINGVDSMNGTWDPPGSDPGIMEYILTTADIEYIWAEQTSGDTYHFVFPMIIAGVWTGVQVYSPVGDLLHNDLTGTASTLDLP